MMVVVDLKIVFGDRWDRVLYTFVASYEGRERAMTKCEAKGYEKGDKDARLLYKRQEMRHLHRHDVAMHPYQWNARPLPYFLSMQIQSSINANTG